MKTWQAAPQNLHRPVAIVVSRFNELVTEKLLQGAIETLKRYGVDLSLVEVAHVPGAFELPLIAQKMAMSGRFAGVVALGAVIRGTTTHYDYVCQGVTSGLMQVSLKHNLPVIFGVLTTNNLEEALERVGGKVGHKGSEAVLTLMEMLGLLNELDSYEQEKASMSC
jgi:6,7-dimethyl-8-ribityllumazine synthase